MHKLDRILGQIKFNHWAPGFEWWGVYQARVPGRRVPGRVPAYLCNISYASPSSKVTTPARSGDLFHSDSDQIYIYILCTHPYGIVTHMRSHQWGQCTLRPNQLFQMDGLGVRDCSIFGLKEPGATSGSFANAIHAPQGRRNRMFGCVQRIHF